MALKFIKEWMSPLRLLVGILVYELCNPLQVRYALA